MNRQVLTKEWNEQTSRTDSQTKPQQKTSISQNTVQNAEISRDNGWRGVRDSNWLKNSGLF